MYKKKLNKIWNYIEKIKNDINLAIISDFLDWFLEKLEIHFWNKNNKLLKFNKWDIYFVKLWKNIWTELNKNRPCIIYSDFYFNNWNDLIIIPLKWYKWNLNKKIHIYLSKKNYWFLIKDSIIDLKWIKQVSKKRIWKKIWILDKDILSKIDKKIIKIFGIKK